MPLPSSLTDAATIRARLQVQSDGGDQDALIDALRQAVEEKILGLTGYAFDNSGNANIYTEQQTDVQLGVSRVMKYRPLLPLDGGADPLAAITLEARSLASNTFNKIIGDLKDAQYGRVMPLASELTPIFPPVGGLAPWFRWRQMIWPVVKFTYKVDPLGSTTNPVPKALVSAAVEWTAFIYAKAAAGAVKDVTIEKVSETYVVEVSTPPIVWALLGRHVREVVVQQF